MSADMEKLPYHGPSVEDIEDKEVKLLLALCRSVSCLNITLLENIFKTSGWAVGTGSPQNHAIWDKK